MSEASPADKKQPRVPQRIETERLVLRGYEPQDADALRRKSAENREHLLPWLPWAKDEPQSLDEKLELIHSFRSKYDADTNSIMGIFDRESGELLGGTGIHPCAGESHRFTREIGYWICADMQGRGYVSEAVRALLVVSFRHIGLLSLIIRCDPENHGSRAIPEKLGFVTEGLLRNSIHRANGQLGSAYRYCMTRQEFDGTEAGEAWRRGQLTLQIFDGLGRLLSIDELKNDPTREA